MASFRSSKIVTELKCKREQNRGHFSLCAVLLSSSGRKSRQIVVKWWQQERLFVWISFRVTSLACGQSLVVDVFLSGGVCIDKVLQPGHRGVNQEVTLTLKRHQRVAKEKERIVFHSVAFLGQSVCGGSCCSPIIRKERNI